MSDSKVKEWEKWFKQFDPVLKDVTRPQERGFRDFVAGRPAPAQQAPAPEAKQNSKSDEKV